MRAITAAHQKDVLYGTAANGLQQLRGLAKHGCPGKSGGEHMPAVDAAHALAGVVSAQSKGLLDQRGEVLMALLVRGDVPQALVAHHRGGVHPVGVAGPGRHQAVGREQNRGGQCIELLLLVLPGGAEVAGQMGVLL